MSNSNGFIKIDRKILEWGSETQALLFQHNGLVDGGYYGRGGKNRDSYFRNYRGEENGWDSDDVEAWMPLPELYKGEQK